MNPALRAERIFVRHDGTSRDVVRDLSLAVAPREVLALVGPNGSGKSSALAALARALRPRLGRVCLGDEDAYAVAPRRFARHVARLAQHPEAPAGLSVESLAASGRHAHRRFLGALGPGDHAAVSDALRALDLLDLRRREVQTLSGGERRRAWIALALAQGARVLLLDEPTAALDLRAEWEVLSLVRRLAEERELAIVLVLHDLEQAARIADRMAILHRGRLYAVGPVSTCLREDTLRDVWGVSARIDKVDGRWRIDVLAPADPTRNL